MGRNVRPEPEGSGFCVLCGKETTTDHFDEGDSQWKYCTVCGDPSWCFQHDAGVGYRIFCPSCCGGVKPSEVSPDLYPTLMESPYQLGCDGCLDEIEAVAKADPVFETAQALMNRGDVSATSAVQAAQVIVGEPL